MATKIRRSFTDEFKREAVSLLTSSGRPLTQVARELGIQPSMLRHWRDDQQTNGPVTRTARSPSSDDMSAEHAEIRRLEKELARAQMERDILKKAIGIFSGPPK
jgi:transposase